MKRVPSFLLSRIAVIGFFAALCASQTVGASPAAGHLVITRSPTLGRDVSITIHIDGKMAGLLSWRRTVETNLAPGRHVLKAVPNRNGTPWQGTLEVRANQTYSYTAYSTAGRVALEPKASSN